MKHNDEDPDLLRFHAHVLLLVLSLATIIGSVMGQTRFAFATFVCSLVAFIVSRKTDPKE